MRLRHPRLIAGTLTAGALIVGLSGPALAGVSAKQAVANAIATTESVTSVRTSDTTMVNNAVQSQTNIFANNAGLGQGTIISGQATVAVRLVSGNVYLKGSTAYWKQNGGTSAVQLFANKWVSVPATSSSGKKLAPDLNANSHIKGFFPSKLTNWVFTYAGTSTVNGQKTTVVVGHYTKSTEPPVHIFMASSGRPYILKVAVSSGSESENIVFSSFNQPVSTVAPSHAIDVANLK